MQFKNYDFLKQWETLRLVAYQDIGGTWTVGWGHTATAKPGMVITIEEAERLLKADIIPAEKTVNENVHVLLTQNQYDALVSLCFNIGVYGFKTSTCLRRLNTGDYTGAVEALLWWNKVKGKISNGLINRRKAEKDLFNSPVVIDEKEAKIKELLEAYTKKILEVINV